MTINKAQGKTIGRVGLLLRQPVFSHGHMYTAESRVSRMDHIRIYVQLMLDQVVELCMNIKTAEEGQLAIADKPHNDPSSYIPFDYKPNLDENDHRYVGLVNQAMTCYLNSLIQTLYMTPEFRNAIYKWKFGGNVSDEVKSIPYQLQKLFLLLQTSTKSSLETKELTASFGWESNDAYDQHDVQELCRLMFDALEHRWKKTENRTLIQDLYRGNLEDYVKCLQCQTEKVKPDFFLDLPLAVKQFGATESFKSIEEALCAFIKPELLDESNKYLCETCNSKQVAEKGLRITDFPYILTIQLKRFDFDYNTLHRIKLNDKMTFPDILDLNDFVHEKAAAQPKMSYAAAAKKVPPPSSSSDEQNKKNTGENKEAENEKDINTLKGLLDEEDESCWHGVSRSSDYVKNLLVKGKYVYELLSIMVHQGNASGGHYFAYIKNLDQDRWFCFNDSLVQAATEQDIFRTFGSKGGGWSISNTNAYMLMYRRIDYDVNQKFTRTTELPDHLKALLERLGKEEEEKDRMLRYQEQHIKINFVCNHKKYIEVGAKCTHISKDVTVSTVLGELQRFFDIFEYNDVDVRLLIADSSFRMKCELPMDQIADETLGCLEKCARSLLLFSSSKVSKDQCSTPSFLSSDLYLILDTKPAHLPFYPIFRSSVNSNSLKTLEVLLVNLDEERVEIARQVWVEDTMTVGGLRQVLTVLAEDNVDVNTMRMVVHRFFDEQSPLVVLNHDAQRLVDCNLPFAYSFQLFIDCGLPETLAKDREESATDFRLSKMFKIIDRRKFSTKLNLILPSQEYIRAGLEPVVLDRNFRALPVTPPDDEVLQNGDHSAGQQFEVDDKGSATTTGNHSVAVEEEKKGEAECSEPLVNNDDASIQDAPRGCIFDRMDYWKNVSEKENFTSSLVDGGKPECGVSCDNSYYENAATAAKKYRGVCTTVLYASDSLPSTSTYDNGVEEECNSVGEDNSLKMLSKNGYCITDPTPPPPYTPPLKRGVDYPTVECSNSVPRRRRRATDDQATATTTIEEEVETEAAEEELQTTTGSNMDTTEEDGSNDMFSLTAATIINRRSDDLADDDENASLSLKHSASDDGYHDEEVDDDQLLMDDDGDDNARLSMSPYGCTPKRSPVVSESGSCGDGAGQSLCDDQRQQLMDDHRYDGCVTVAAARPPPPSSVPFNYSKNDLQLIYSIMYTINVLNLDTTSERPCLELELDRRLRTDHFKQWMAQFLGVPKERLRIFKHYQERSFVDDGYELSDSSTVHEDFVSVNHLVIRLSARPTMTSGIENDYVGREQQAESSQQQRRYAVAPMIGCPNRSEVLTDPVPSVTVAAPLRRERPLRIQMSSFSEND